MKYRIIDFDKLHSIENAITDPECRNRFVLSLNRVVKPTTMGEEETIAKFRECYEQGYKRGIHNYSVGGEFVESLTWEEYEKTL